MRTYIYQCTVCKTSNVDSAIGLPDDWVELNVSHSGGQEETYDFCDRCWALVHEAITYAAEPNTVPQFVPINERLADLAAVAMAVDDE